MTNVMIFLSERDDSAYDAFREGLFQIGAPKHVTDLLPDLKKERVDSSQIQQSQVSEIEEYCDTIEEYSNEYMCIFCVYSFKFRL